MLHEQAPDGSRISCVPPSKTRNLRSLLERDIQLIGFPQDFAFETRRHHHRILSPVQNQDKIKALQDCLANETKKNGPLLYVHQQAPAAQHFPSRGWRAGLPEFLPLCGFGGLGRTSASLKRVMVISFAK